MSDWLSRALARAGVLAPDEVDRAIRSGRVKVNGRVVRQPMLQLRPGDEVRVDGRRASLEAPTLVVVLHEPAGTVTSTTDPRGGQTVFDVLHRALPAELRRYRWHAVGRLDKDTTGLLLFTNDERVVERVTSPTSKIAKRYVATVGADADDARLEPLRRGIALGKERLKPAAARARDRRTVEPTLTEGSSIR